MNKRTNKKSISNLAALLVFCVFAVTVLAVLLGGAGAYRRLTQRDQRGYDSRTCVQYLATKVRQASAPEAVILSSFGTGDALVLMEEIEGEAYCTRIYCHDGWLMELFAVAEGDFAPEDGEKILKAKSMELECKGKMLSVEIVDGNGMKAEQFLSLRGREGALE